MSNAVKRGEAGALLLFFIKFSPAVLKKLWTGEKKYGILKQMGAKYALLRHKIYG